MRFNDNARLDTSQVQDRRGSGGGGGGFNLGGRGGLVAGGGGLAVVVAIVVVLINVFSGGSGSSTGGQVGNYLNQLGGAGNTGAAAVDNSKLASECQSGAQANAGNDDCVVVGIINSVQAFWKGQLAASGVTYTNAETIFFTDSTSTGCGEGTSGMGPFYCPSDKNVYIDLAFWNELKTSFNANDAPFTQAYVLAHEYGHHVQDILGTNAQVSTAQGATSGSVRLELQADCYAGVWAKNASTTPGADGQVLITDITTADLNNALDTAAKIGDDYIQTQIAKSNLDPSQFTHGTSAQRKKWLMAGYNSGRPTSCDTFSATNLG